MSDRLANLRPAPGSVHPRKRVGRGIAAGQGKTAGRGTKGQKSRGKVRPGFEGGQTPLARRVPHLRGFKPRARKEFAVVNVARLAVFEAGTEVTPEVLLERRIISGIKDGVKILGDGELDRPLAVRAHKFSASAEEKIRGAGGTVEVVPAGLRGAPPQVEAESR